MYIFQLDKYINKLFMSHVILGRANPTTRLYKAIKGGRGQTPVSFPKTKGRKRKVPTLTS